MKMADIANVDKDEKQSDSSLSRKDLYSTSITDGPVVENSDVDGYPIIEKAEDVALAVRSPYSLPVACIRLH